jgi:mannose-6-phosphate isomerase-like protein (cupin superfamily)
MANKYEHLIVRRPMNVTELPNHDLSQVIPYPVLMCNELVPEANAWAMYLFIKEITQELKDIAIKTDKATPHMHNFDEMYLMIGDPGAITFEVMLGDETYEVVTPSAVYIPKKTPHAIRPVDATVGMSGGLIPVCLNGEYVTIPVDDKLE